jgi:hypothetical protein
MDARIAFKGKQMVMIGRTSSWAISEVYFRIDKTGEKV